MKPSIKTATVFAIAAAILYALSTPLSKLLLNDIKDCETIIAGLLYLGAGFGMAGVTGIRRIFNKSRDEKPLTKKELPYTVAMCALDIAAPICLLIGLSKTSPENAALLNNFEVVATAIIAFVFFKEKISKRLWLAIGFVTLASVMLTFEDISCLKPSIGSLFVLMAATCWGLENNCTRCLSVCDPYEIIVINGVCSGVGSLVIGFIIGQKLPPLKYIVFALLIGFVAYGMSVVLYVYAQRILGAAKTSSYYATAPFAGAFLSLIIFAKWPALIFWPALGVMIIGAYLATLDSKKQL